MPAYCTHRVAAMDTVLGSITLVSCNTRACFGYEDTGPTACAKHRSPRMVDVLHPMCKQKDCKKHASFAMDNHRPKFCRTHAEPGMVNVVTKRCKAHGCMSVASCGFSPELVPPPGFQPNRVYFCASHRLEGMINYLSKRRVVNSKKRLHDDDQLVLTAKQARRV